MAFDGLVTRAISYELNNNLKDGKINKIYEPNKNELFLEIYNKQKFLLNICIDASNCRINLTKHQKQNPKIAPNFCMLLRKYLISSKITSIETYNMDRIVIINIESYNELNDLVQYKLIIELMGKHSNVILINNKDIIIDSMRHISGSNAARNILPANIYTFPTSDKLNLLSTPLEVFVETITSRENKDLINTVSNFFEGINNSFMIYTLNELKIDNNEFTNSDLINLYNYIMNIINLKNLKFNEIALKNKTDFVISYNEELQEKNLNLYIDEYYFKKESIDTFINYRNTLLKLILSLLSKYNKKLLYIDEKLNECNKMDEYKLYGELITTNLYKINNNINLPEINLENYYNNNTMINIPLDSKYSPSYNAKMYFKKYNKLKNTLAIVTNQKNEIKSEIRYLESILYSIENASNINELDEIHSEIEENVLKYSSLNKKQKIKENKLEIDVIDIDSFKVYIGKNNKQNDIITFKLSDKNDIWFHVQGFTRKSCPFKNNWKRNK